MNALTQSQPRLWRKEDIEAFLRTEALGYQKIDLPYGLSTPGADRSELCDLAFGTDVLGKSVLDAGSYLGYFCLAALERGASSAHGLEVDPEKIAQARALADMKSLAPTYECADLETADLGQSYDIVLCLNVLHHLFDPIGTLHRLARATRETLILEVASINPRDSRKLGLGRVVQSILARLPVMLVARGAPIARRRADIQKFFFTSHAIRRVLEDHTKLFATVEVLPSSFKGRFIVRAKRRKIGHLLIVSGPTSSGKSTFLDMVRNGRLPGEIAARLPEDCGSWPQIDASRLFRMPVVDSAGNPLTQAHMAGLILHYDILRPYVSGSQVHGRDQALDLVACAEKVTVVVLRPSLDRLVSQLKSGELRPADERRQTISMKSLASAPPVRNVLRKLESAVGKRLLPKDKSRYVELLRRYETPGWVEGWYARWLNYLKGAHSNLKVVDLRWPPLA